MNATTDLPDRDAIEAAARLVYAAMPPTPQYAWPQLAAALGAEVWVKHENHTPLGAFKIRGGLVHFERLARDAACFGVIGATRGNHGQSMAFAARRAGLRCVVVVPRGNSREKNAAMRALGAELVEHGDDFQAAREHAAARADAERLRYVASFHPDLVAGVATYWAELFSAVPDLDVVYVPIGQGSGINACAAARNALSPGTRIVGVTSAHARAYALSLAAGRLIDAPVSTVLADGLACRSPDAQSLAVIAREVERIVEVSDAEVAEAMRLMFRSTHNVAEGAGAASLAAAMQERERLRDKRVGVTLCGGNVDADVFARVLAGTWSMPLQAAA
ncbi:MAG: threonine dehydratase [Burkholderiaceae bacterium]|jgi:threonine dehydratase|nr:threonine dehydratase [Burkholderiaceae bacterium]